MLTVLRRTAGRTHVPALAALVAVPLLLSGCSSGDGGGEAVTPVEEVEASPETSAASALYQDAVGRWSGDGIALTLDDDGTGDLELCAGQIAPANWDVHWSGGTPDIGIEIGEKTGESELIHLINEVEPGQRLEGTVGSGTLDLYGYIPGEAWPLNRTEPVASDWECGAPPR